VKENGETKMDSFINYLRGQKEILGTLIEQLENGEGDQSSAIFYIDMDRLAFWLNGHPEDLTDNEGD
jgi:hypothetical protein